MVKRIDVDLAERIITTAGDSRVPLPAVLEATSPPNKWGNGQFRPKWKHPGRNRLYTWYHPCSLSKRSNRFEETTTGAWNRCKAGLPQLFYLRKKGRGYVRSGYTIWHICHVVRRVHITLKQLSYPPLNEMHTNMTLDYGSHLVCLCELAEYVIKLATPATSRLRLKELAVVLIQGIMP